MNEAVGKTISRTLPNTFKVTAGTSVISILLLPKNRNTRIKRLALIGSPEITLFLFHEIPVPLW